MGSPISLPLSTQPSTSTSITHLNSSLKLYHLDIVCNETSKHLKMTINHNKDSKHDKHAQREALRSLGSSNHLLNDALRGRRGTPDTRSQTINRATASSSLLPPILPTVTSTRTGGQATQSQRTQSHSSPSQRPQSSRTHEQQVRHMKRRERERRERDVTRRKRNQCDSAKQPNRGKLSSSQLHRQYSSHVSGLSAGAGPSTLRRQTSLDASAGSSSAGPFEVQRPQGLLRQVPRPRAKPRPEDQFIREGGRGFRCILCRDQSYISMQFSRKHVLQKHADALPQRDRSIRVHNCPLCDFVSHEKKGVTLHMTRKHNRKDG